VQVCETLTPQGGKMEQINVTDPELGLVARSYFLYVPENDGQTPMPVLVGLHGQGGDGQTWAGWHSFRSLGKSYGFISVYPDGMADSADSNSGWNVGTAADDSTCVPDTHGASCHTSCEKLKRCGRCNWSSCYDDVAFVAQVLPNEL
jgi:poly(3-hydroxybutyrate) depolymerase